MKRPLYVACLLFLMSSPLLAQYEWPFVISLRPSPIWIDSQTEPDTPDFEDKDGLRCYCVTHKIYHKCVRQLFMLGLSDEDCSPTVLPECGHTKSEHSPPDFLNRSDFYRIGGFLTDSRKPDDRVKTIFVGNGPGDPLTLPWKYTAGEVTGTHRLYGLATDLPPLHFFLRPPYGFCESASSCSIYFTIRVHVPNLIELPAPSTFFPVTSQPIPYVRCGLTGDAACPGNIDVPYNWPAHRHTHWGTPQAVAALMEVASRWYENCSDYAENPATGQDVIETPQDLVISDMSLPLGGLFDVRQDWTPTYRGQSSLGHSSHREGKDIDLSRVSVPLTGVCGTRPDDGTRDPLWKSTDIWSDNFALLVGTKLRPLRDDYGHLRWDEKNK